MQAIPVESSEGVTVFERHNTCLHCGYDLFGQPRIGVCPECGASTRESARHEAFLSAPGNLSRLRVGSRLLLISAILSGLCPASCLLFMWADENIAVAILITVVFGATVATSAVGERRFAAMGEFRMADANDRDLLQARARGRIADIVAAAGLLLINLAAYVMSIQRGARSSLIAGIAGETFAWAVVVFGFLLLSITAWRAVPSYRMRSRIAQSCLGSQQNGFVSLGHFKAIYETIWLSCIWLGPALTTMGSFAEGLGITVLFAALFGLIGFAVIWIFMITLHAILVAKINRQFSEASRGFEVVSRSDQLEGVTR